MSTATLVITRTHSYNGMIRDAAILVDDEKVGVVGNGKSLEITLTPGRHAIRSRMDWEKSPVLELDAVAGGRYAAELKMCNPFLALFALLHFMPYMQLKPQ